MSYLTNFIEMYWHLSWSIRVGNLLDSNVFAVRLDKNQYLEEGKRKEMESEKEYPGFLIFNCSKNGAVRYSHYSNNFPKF